jgi:small-conductance mechanosensitive channel
MIWAILFSVGLALYWRATRKRKLGGYLSVFTAPIDTRRTLKGLLTTKWYRAEQPIHLLPRWLEIVLWFSIAIIIAFAFASELGSVATFAGLITAAVALALKA